MRIIGGVYRGRRLASPHGPAVRPTSDRVREAIFDVLAGKVAGASVLDLFAGTGALGLEALSRGATRAVFVDGSTRSLAVIRRNIQDLGLEQTARVIKADLPGRPGRLSGESGPFDLIFLDPPYGKNLIAPTLDLVTRLGLAGQDAGAVVELSTKEPIPGFHSPWTAVKEKIYGQTRIIFLAAEAGRLSRLSD